MPQFTVEVVENDEAARLVSSEGFLQEWRSLAEACPWATSFQGPAFATAWYESYRARFDPLLIIQRGDGGDLLGLLTLAVDRRDGRILVAGGGQAEYHAWISRTEYTGSFAEAVLDRIEGRLTGAGLAFRYLPPGAPTEWLASSRLRARTLLKRRRRPLMELGDGSDAAASLAKGSNKSRLKRLSRIGSVSFERITDPARMDEVFDAIITDYDTRRTALNDVAPFRQDPCKRPFHLAMLRSPGLLHASVLRVGDVIAASHLGVVSGKELQLGLLSHNPFLAKHSPGKFLMLFLARSLVEDGFERIDLTAGGEPYKERFANAWDDVHTLEVYPGRLTRGVAGARSIAEDWARSTLHRYDISPARARTFVRELRRRGPSALWRRPKESARGPGRLYTLAIRPEHAFDRPEAIRRNDPAAVLACQSPPGGESRQGFVSRCLGRIEEGAHLYTCVEDQRLRHMSWLDESPGESLDGVALPAASAAASGLFTDPVDRGRGLATAALRAMAADLATGRQVRQLVMSLPEDAPGVRGLVERLGFVPLGSAPTPALTR